MELFSGRAVVALLLAGFAAHLYNIGFGLGDVWYVRAGDVRPAALAGLSLAYVALHAVRWLKFRQRIRWWEAGRCSWCGYDLREATDRCPECGDRFEDDAA